MSSSFSRVATTLFVCVCALVTAASAADLAQPGVCVREGAKLAGTTPVQISKALPQPKKIHHVTPKYPVTPPGMITKGGPWIGELLVDQKGSVLEVWSIREVGFTPPFPAFNRAIVDAFRQWRFEPLVLKGQAMPWCTTVTVQINWS